MTSSPSAPLPRHLTGAARRVEPLLSEAHPERLVASKKKGDVVARDSLAALYALASRLHSRQVPFQAKTIETSRQKHVTTEQIWGQMNMLLRPVLRRLQDRVRTAERLYRDSDSSQGKGTRRAKKNKKASFGSEEDDDESQDATEDHDVASNLSESDLDDEIAALLEKQKLKKKSALKGKESLTDGKTADGDAWRYAFGRGNDEDEDEEDEEDGEEGGRRGPDPKRRRRRGDDDMDDMEDAHDFIEDDINPPDGRGGRHVRDRNARAMLDAEVDGGSDGDEAAANEELAALKEMYGDDFDDDGEGFAGKDDSGVDSDLEALLDEADRTKRPQRHGEEGEQDTFTEADAHYWGKEDMLNDLAGDYEGGEDPTQAGYSGWNDRYGDGEEGQNTFMNDDQDTAAAEVYDEEFEKAMQDPSLTEFEKQRMREAKYVKTIEEKRLYGTDWTMAGETAASKRPRDALLEVDDLEFDYGMKAVPVVTEAFTAKLEDRIRQRILDASFDDVARRKTHSAPEDLHTTRRDAAIDAEKSKLSLMDLYEKEFLEKMQKAEEAAGGASAVASAEPLTEIEKDELRAIQMWKRLSQHLDALSNFHFTPKPVQTDLEARVRAVENQAPAIAMETVGNFATTREKALAPQDLFRVSSRKTSGIGADEMTPQERHALRNARKATSKTKEAIKKSVRAEKGKGGSKSKGGDLSSVA